MFKVYKDKNNVRVVEVDSGWYRLEYPTDVYFIPKQVVMKFFELETIVSHIKIHHRYNKNNIEI